MFFFFEIKEIIIHKSIIDNMLDNKNNINNILRCNHSFGILYNKRTIKIREILCKVKKDVPFCLSVLLSLL